MIRVIGFKDIYYAWESQVVSFIEDYMEDMICPFSSRRLALGVACFIALPLESA